MKRPPGPALAVLGALLDRSLVQIAGAAVDARVFDRETIGAVTDVWDNNTFPLFRAATAGTRRERERRAFAALEWMAALSARRRAWMLEQATTAGHNLKELLPPAKDDPPGRDYRGRVIAPASPVTPDVAADLATDYDLASATVRYLRVERAGTRLIGYLQLAVARTYPTDGDTSAEPAKLDVRLEDLTAVRFDSYDVEGAVLRSESGGIVIAIGAHGTLHAAAADLRPDDRLWHRSAAGRRVDTLTPPRSDQTRAIPPPQRGRLEGTAEAAATILQRAMLEIRLVQYPDYADRVPIEALCRAFAGAGEAVLAAGAPLGSRRREAAFGHLIETWIQRGGAPLVPWFTSLLRDATNWPDILASVRAQTYLPDSAPPPVPRPKSTPRTPRQAELRMAEYTAEHDYYGTHRNASAHLHLALAPPPEDHQDNPWRLRAPTPSRAPRRPWTTTPATSSPSTTAPSP